MKTVDQVLERLIREAQRRDPSFVPTPETEERLAEAERCMGEPLPAGYREFLAKVGRITWPYAIGNVVDLRNAEVPSRFVPFGRRNTLAYDTLVFVRRRAERPRDNAQLASDLRATIAGRRERIASLAEEDPSADEEEIDDLEAEVDALEEEVANLEITPRQTRRSNKHVPIEWFDAEKGNLHSAPEWDASGPWMPSDEDEESDNWLTSRSFLEWLDEAVKLAIGRDALLAAPKEYDDTPNEPARTLLDLLVAREQIVLSADFDEDAAVARLESLYGDAERFHAALLELDGIDEVFLSENDLEIFFDAVKEELTDKSE